MNLDRGLAAQRKTRPVFLDLKTADIVIVWEHPDIVGSDENAWWMGQVIFCEGGARDAKVNRLFQVADVDTGVILWINADEVSDVIWSMDGWPTSTPIYGGH